MAEFNDPEIRQIADQIERYLNSRPHAADTIEGITKWWLLGKRVEVSTVVVQQALNYLEAKSIVKAFVNLSGNNVYSSTKERTDTQPK